MLKEEHKGKSVTGFIDMFFDFSQALVTKLNIINSYYGCDFIAFHFQDIVEDKDAAYVTIAVKDDCFNWNVIHFYLSRMFTIVCRGGEMRID